MAFEQTSQRAFFCVSALFFAASSGGDDRLVRVHEEEREMRRIIAALHVSVDGFIEGPNGELDWVKHELGEA
jgi:hypothetical protein